MMASVFEEIESREPSVARAKKSVGPGMPGSRAMRDMMVVWTYVVRI